MTRVKIPKKPDEMLTLVGDIIIRENANPAESNLSPAEIVELTGYRDAGRTANNLQKELSRQAEEQTGIRNNALGLGDGQKVDVPGSAMYLITKLRDILLAKNKTNPKALGNWGFEVDDSPQGGGTPPPVV